MPEVLPGDQPRICACPGCDEVVVQSDPANKRLYHSAACRRKARRLRHEHHEADTVDLPPAAPPPGRPAADLAPASESAAAGFPGTARLPGSAAGHDAVSATADYPGADAAEDPDDSVFWPPGTDEADGFWDVGRDSPAKDVRSAGRHRSAASQRSRLKRSHTVAIALTLAASAAGLGLIFSQPSPRHPLASDAQLHPPGTGGTRPAPSPSSSPAGRARTRHAGGHAAGGTSHAPRPPAASPSPPPATRSPTPPPSPKPSRSPKTTRRVSPGLISFENGTDGWMKFFGSIRVSRTTRVAYSGAHSLLITTRSSDSAVGVENGSVARLRPGDKVTFHIYSDGQSGASVKPFAEQHLHPEALTAQVQLPSRRGWFSLTWVVPSVARVDAIGVQILYNGSGPLTLAIDALSWTGS